jgi:uncharacterized protein YerC
MGTKIENPLDELFDRKLFGYWEDWASAIDFVLDIHNSGKLDPITFRALKMALEGFSLRAIGDELGMSHGTVARRLRSLIRSDENGN